MSILPWKKLLENIVSRLHLTITNCVTTSKKKIKYSQKYTVIPHTQKYVLNMYTLNMKFKALINKYLKGYSPRLVTAKVFKT